ncbi:MAG: shikimate kinase [Pseudomonadota bacterium]
MQILLTGVACVGKSSIGKKLAEDIGHVFFDLDVEIEKYYTKSISRLKAGFITEYGWRLKVVTVFSLSSYDPFVFLLFQDDIVY